ncbi:MAG: 30S ribosome-binding factor RbfA [Acidimicrobiia bacterium]|nr:30S ribosome-binding factor RbfA [Acidimicrobiia bacterium]
MRKVNELMREVIAEEIALLKDPRLGFVTVTDVRTAPDLRKATVYYSVLEAKDEEGSAAALQSAHHRIQKAIANQAHLKYTPVLEFERDDALERGLRISKLLHDLEDENG